MPQFWCVVEINLMICVSLRTWKTKVKEWGFFKNLNAQEMQIVIAKKEKRLREGKETVIMLRDQEITTQRMSAFKKRKLNNDDPTALESAG